MTVAINLFLATVANCLVFSPLYLIPNLKISRLKFIIIIAVWGTVLGNLKYFFEPNSVANLIYIIANNVSLFVICALSIKNKFGRVIFAYGLSAAFAFTAESVERIIGIDLNCSITDEHTADMFIMHILVILVLTVILYLIMRRLNNDAEKLTVDVLGSIGMLLITFYCIISLIYFERILDNLNASIYIILNFYISIILILVVVKTILENKKRYIAKYRQAYEKESIRLNELMRENEYIAKLRHDYINQISIVKKVAKDEPDRAIEILREMKEQY